MGAKLCIHLEFDFASLVDVGILRAGTLISSRAYAANHESTDAVGTSHVELLRIGCSAAVAVCPYDTSEYACGKRDV